MKFTRDESFDDQFKKIEGIIWYPYVGKSLGKDGKRIMVYAHNIPTKPDDYEKRKIDWMNKDKPVDWTSTETIHEYTYETKRYTKAFRSFIKGAVGVNYGKKEKTEPSIIDRIDSFVDRIAYINFTQDLVVNEKQCANPLPEQVRRSKLINQEILKILGITHCICWGKEVYANVRNMNGFKILSEKDEGKTGFASCSIDLGEGKTMRCLKTFHPSMPGFGCRTETTHSIISRFLDV